MNRNATNVTTARANSRAMNHTREQRTFGPTRVVGTGYDREATMANGQQELDNRNAPPATVVIFGASGDLTRRKLIPAIQSLARHDRLTERFAIVGVARTPMDDQQFTSAVLSEPVARQLDGAFRYISGGYDDPETYKRLKALLDDLDVQRSTAGNRLFYLSTPPQAFPQVVNGLAGAGLNVAHDGSF